MNHLPVVSRTMEAPTSELTSKNNDRSSSSKVGKAAQLKQRKHQILTAAKKKFN